MTKLMSSWVEVYIIWQFTQTFSWAATAAAALSCLSIDGHFRRLSGYWQRDRIAMKRLFLFLGRNWPVRDVWRGIKGNNNRMALRKGIPELFRENEKFSGSSLASLWFPNNKLNLVILGIWRRN